jgi:hypothetical protein
MAGCRGATRAGKMYLYKRPQPIACRFPPGPASRLAASPSLELMPAYRRIRNGSMVRRSHFDWYGGTVTDRLSALAAHRAVAACRPGGVR